MRKTFKYRLYPSRKQIERLEQTLNTCRILYNNALAERKQQAEMYMLPVERDWIGYHEQAVSLPKQKEDNPFLPQVHSQVLQDTLRRLDKSFKSFFRRVKVGEKPGYPRFKNYWRYNSFTYPQIGFRLDGKKLLLSKIGTVNIKLHRPMEGTTKTCTLRRDIDRWYACFSVEFPNTHTEKVEVRKAVGVDVGLSSLVTLSTGEKIEPPKFLQKSEEKLAREQRRLSRKKKGSKNRPKQRIRVAKVHRKIRDQRTDFNHKLSRVLVNNYDLIAFEDLRIKNMLKNHHLAKGISDAGWGQLQTFTTYKAEEAGKHTEFVVPHNTSKECSKCGALMNMTLAKRTFRCTSCGFVLDRDHNAAINILKKVGQGLPDLMPAGGSPLGVPMNQEATLLVGW